METWIRQQAVGWFVILVYGFKIYWPRYLLPLVPFKVLFMAYAFEPISSFPKEQWRKFLKHAVFFIVIGLIISGASGYGIAHYLEQERANRLERSPQRMRIAVLNLLRFYPNDNKLKHALVSYDEQIKKNMYQGPSYIQYERIGREFERLRSMSSNNHGDF